MKKEERYSKLAFWGLLISFIPIVLVGLAFLRIIGLWSPFTLVFILLSPIVSVAFSIISLVQISRNGLKGKTYAIIGLVISGLEVLAALYVLSLNSLV